MRRTWSKTEIAVVAFGLACGAALLVLELMPARDEAAAVARDIETIAERACACKDPDCARYTLQEFGRLAASGANKDMHMSEATRARLVDAGHKFGTCVQRAGVTEAEVRDAVGKYVKR